MRCGSWPPARAWPAPTAGPPPVGADIERIRPRIRRFVTDYFTAVEIDQPRTRPRGSTIRW
ncbi:MAG: hypothetical protein HZY76_16605 [Anaerolineae bacterium]|nr:MAG: hypothetical protein HZY76_16605 [Anaerolineae bacterium]